VSSAPTLPHLEKKDDNYRVTRMAKVMTMAHILRRHDRQDKRELGERAVALFRRHGELDEEVIRNVVAMTTSSSNGLLSPSAAAQADLEWTAKDANHYGGAEIKEGGAEQPFEEVAAQLDEVPPYGDTKGPYQGDMFAANEDQAALLRGLLVRSTNSVPPRYGAGTPWTDNRVPYCFAKDTPQGVIDSVEYAVEQFRQAVPCIQMVDVGRSPTEGCRESPAVYITSADTGCWSYVGMISDWMYQGLNLQSPGCDSIGTAMHELLHSLGQAHEQSRPDRGDYVSVNYDKVEEGMEGNFDIDTFGDRERPYDMLSIMHYETDAFSIDGSSTITAKDAAYGLYTNDSALFYKYKFGNRIGMTQMDANQLADQYSCEASQLVDEGPCTDVDNTDGTKWADSYNQDCNFYRGLDQGCTGYISSSYCCGCGGGIQLQTWMPHDKAVKLDASPPPPSPPPPSPPSPPPPDWTKGCSLKVDIASSPTCNAWKSYGYCSVASYYYNFVLYHCDRTCSEVPTNKYTNCDSLAAAGFCKYYFTDGEKVDEGCPDSCHSYNRADRGDSDCPEYEGKRRKQGKRSMHEVKKGSNVQRTVLQPRNANELEPEPMAAVRTYAPEPRRAKGEDPPTPDPPGEPGWMHVSAGRVPVSAGSRGSNFTAS